MQKLMIVDDSNVIRSKIRRSVQSERFKLVASASNGAEAITHFKATKPDVVTMDLTMPNMDGIACIEQLIRLNPDVLILVVSALSDKATGIEALEKGARGFLLKPFTEQDMNAALLELTDFLYV
ncbi:MAG: response regulator [Reinekea sp.]|jgi:two-component system chemotaxis response regulator CheY|nr:response regulator [Reinekea sp.]MDX1475558.1 response regulator [Reinekea sp.]